jgi:hypothetical protein
MFVFKYLKLKSNERANPKRSFPENPVPGTDQDSYTFNMPLFLLELMIVMMLASIDYILFCVIPKKRKQPGRSQV